MSEMIASATPAGIVAKIMPYIILLIIAIVLIVVIFGARPTIGGLQI